MDSEIVYLQYEASVTFDWHYGGEWSVELEDNALPREIRMWIMEVIGLTYVHEPEEENVMVTSSYQKYEVEVEVFHSENKVVKATCHTVCPNYVKAYFEQEAMKKFNLEHTKVTL